MPIVEDNLFHFQGDRLEVVYEMIYDIEFWTRKRKSLCKGHGRLLKTRWAVLQVSISQTPKFNFNFNFNLKLKLSA